MVKKIASVILLSFVMCSATLAADSLDESVVMASHNQLPLDVPKLKELPEQANASDLCMQRKNSVLEVDQFKNPMGFAFIRGSLRLYQMNICGSSSQGWVTDAWNKTARSIANELWLVGHEMDRVHRQVVSKMPVIQREIAGYFNRSKLHLSKSACRVNARWCLNKELKEQSQVVLAQSN